LDANSLNKTATGVQQIISRAQRRMLLIARLFAETGFKRAFKKILRSEIRHQNKARTIRIRNDWVQMDPTDWNADMDVNINVGLGYGTQEQQAAMLERLLGIQLKGVEMQGGVTGPLITADNLYASLKLYPKALGYKGPEQFFTDPKEAPPQQPKPDPKMVEAQGKVQAKQAEVQGSLAIKQAQMQADNQHQAAQLQQDAMSRQVELRLQAMEMQMKSALEQQAFQHKMALEEFKAQHDMALESMKSAHAMKMAEQKPNGAAT
jgi:hypothetical protein